MFTFENAKIARDEAARFLKRVEDYIKYVKTSVIYENEKTAKRLAVKRSAMDLREALRELNRQ